MSRRKGSMSQKQKRGKRRFITERDGPGCHWCGSSDDSTLDHVTPVSAGGSHHVDNLVLSCEDCNQRRGGVHGPNSFNPGTLTYKKSALDTSVLVR